MKRLTSTVPLLRRWVANRLLAILILLPAPVVAQTNFLIISFDDLRVWNDTILERIYPDAGLRAANAARLTPDLDRLSTRAVTFSNAICPVPICNPARISMLSGVRSWQSGLYGNGAYWADYPVITNRATFIHSALKAGGYQTVGIGKVFNSSAISPPNDYTVSNGWSNFISTAPSTIGNVSEHAYSPVGAQIRTTDGTLAQQPGPILAAFASNLLATGTASHDDSVLESSVEINLTEPFALFVGFTDPHTPHDIPDSGAWLTNFPVADMTGVTDTWFSAIASDTNDLSSATLAYLPYATHTDLVAASPGDSGAAAYRTWLQYYLADCKLAWQEFGFVLDGLEAGAYNTNTVVILWSDSGYGVGSKTWVGAKSLPWPEICRVPFYISDPFTSNQWGSVSTAPVNLMDVYRTALDYAGVTPGSYAAGESIRRFVEDPTLVEAGRWTYGDALGGAMRYYMTYDGFFADTDMAGDFEIYASADDEGTTNLVGQTVWDARAAQTKVLGGINIDRDEWWNTAPGSTMRIGVRAYPK